MGSWEQGGYQSSMYPISKVWVPPWNIRCDDSVTGCDALHRAKNMIFGKDICTHNCIKFYALPNTARIWHFCPFLKILSHHPPRRWSADYSTQWKSEVIFARTKVIFQKGCLCGNWQPCPQAVVLVWTCCITWSPGKVVVCWVHHWCTDEVSDFSVKWLQCRNTDYHII